MYYAIICNYRNPSQQLDMILVSNKTLWNRLLSHHWRLLGNTSFPGSINSREPLYTYCHGFLQLKTIHMVLQMLINSIIVWVWLKMIEKWWKHVVTPNGHFKKQNAGETLSFWIKYW